MGNTGNPRIIMVSRLRSAFGSNTARLRLYFLACLLMALYGQFGWTTRTNDDGGYLVVATNGYSLDEPRLHHEPDLAVAPASNPLYHSFNLTFGNPLNPKSLGKLSIQSLAARGLRSNAIVMLVQKKHSSYEGRDSYGMLLQTLQLLRDHYLMQQPENLDNVDIFLFHTGDFYMEDVQRIESILLNATTTDQHKHSGLVKLVNLDQTPYWRLPHNLRHDNASQWHVANLFSVGYRHMCRFFAIQIWDFFQQLNTQQAQVSAFSHTPYDYIWRLDEDSLILSDISYNVFDYMRQHDYVYGFRLCSYELNHHYKFMPHWFERWHSSMQHKAKRWPLSSDLCGVYNNFFVARLEFFQSKPMQAFLKREIDQRGFLYRQRYGDLQVHSLAIYTFAQPSQIHRFLDFTYQHVTLAKHSQHGSPSCQLLWGAIQAGYLDRNAEETLQTFSRKYQVNQCLEYCHHQEEMQNKSGMGDNSTTSYVCPVHVHELTSSDLSPSYAHLPDKYRNLTLPTIAAGKVELEGVGILSG